MKNLFKSTMIVALAIISLQSCKDDDIKPPVDNTSVTQELVIKNYAKMVYDYYASSLKDAETMQTALKAFTDAPSEVTHEAAKKAWLTARESYGLTEVFRGSNGPIDTDVIVGINNEGQMNAWPLNEAYIDYVADKDPAGTKGDDTVVGTYEKSIIEDSGVVIEKSKLAELNEAGGSDEKAVSTGWHAIEFLLWGQDNTAPSQKKAGLRKFTDFTSKENADRRIKYLNETASLLIDDLTLLVNTWKEGGAYYKIFMALSKEQALKNIINGPFFLASSELSEERMDAPVDGTSGIAGGEGQEDEHSCFSDNTHRDVVQNAQGIFDVLLKSKFVELVKAKDATQGTKLETKITEAKKAIIAIDAKVNTGTPFDLMIMTDGANGKDIVTAGSTALKKLGNVIKESAAKIGITPELPKD